MVGVSGRVDPARCHEIEVAGLGPAGVHAPTVVDSDVALDGQHVPGGLAAGVVGGSGDFDADDFGGLLILGVGGEADGGQEAENEGGDEGHHLCG